MQSLPVAFWTMPTTQNGVRLNVSTTEHFSTFTIFWLRFGASGTTFDSYGCHSTIHMTIRSPRWKDSGSTGCVGKLPAGSNIQTVSVWFS